MKCKYLWKQVQLKKDEVNECGGNKVPFSVEKGVALVFEQRKHCVWRLSICVTLFDGSFIKVTRNYSQKFIGG